MTTPNLHAYTQNIKDAKEISDELGFDLILDCGSLLGAYREGWPIKRDADDIDFAVDYNVAEFKMLDVVSAFSARGFILHRLRPTVMTFKRDGVKVDLLFYKYDAVFPDSYYITLYHNKRPHALLTCVTAYDDLGEIEYMGVRLKCPKDVEAHLEYRYGDWKTPVLRPAFSFQNYIDKGVMIPL